MAYSRENPYQLLTHWIPDQEPYERIVHQVSRDLGLVAHLGAATSDTRLLLSIGDDEKRTACGKLLAGDVNPKQPYIIFHPVVSEPKREYPVSHWIKAGQLVVQKYDVLVLVTGSASERELASAVAHGIGDDAVCVAGTFTLGEFAEVVAAACCVVSVNTATIHIAAAMQSPVVVLYAQTNPQHTPWKCPSRVLSFSVPERLKSRNTIIRHVSETLYGTFVPYPDPEQILSSMDSLMLETATRLRSTAAC